MTCLQPDLLTPAKQMTYLKKTYRMRTYYLVQLVLIQEAVQLLQCCVLHEYNTWNHGH